LGPILRCLADSWLLSRIVWRLIDRKELGNCFLINVGRGFLQLGDLGAEIHVFVLEPWTLSDNDLERIFFLTCLAFPHFELA
jgi:hypothetical protein